MIEVDGLTVTYGDFAAVRGVTFQVRPGELHALLGTNGAGTTSTLEVLEGHRRATSGTVRIFGGARGTGVRCVRAWASCCRKAAQLPT